MRLLHHHLYPPLPNHTFGTFSSNFTVMRKDFLLKEGQIYCRGLVLKTIYQIGSVLKQIAGGSIIYVGAVIVTGVKLVTSLAITGTAMPPLAAAGRGGERRETRHWCWQDRKREETRHWH